MRWRRGKSAGAGGELTAFVDESAEFEGQSRFTGTAMLHGKFRGEIASTGTLVIGEKGVIHASIQAATVLIGGEVVGPVTASERIELRARARVHGDLESPVVVIEEGALFEGHCRMTKASPAEAAPPARDLSVVLLKR